jgi:1,4-alpha-glucan branching enzyme
VPREGWRVGLPWGGTWAEALNSDAKEYWGGGVGNAGVAVAEPQPWQGMPASALVTLPPLGVVILISNHGIEEAG